MKHIKHGGRITLLLVMAFSLTTAVPTQAEVPQVINFQGILRDGSGNPVANGSYSVLFTIYDAPTAGTSLWFQTYSVTTNSGLFTVLLGSGPTAIPAATFDDTSRYLGIKVGADPEMTPRQPLVSVGYSFVSSQWTSADTNLYLLDGNVSIGTTPSGARLDVQSPSGTAIVGVGGSTGVDANGGLYGVISSGGSTGVFSSSSGYAGVQGQGGTHGVYGLGVADGVYGSGGSSGVYGTGGTYGVYGYTGGSGDGVYGISSGGNGVNAAGGTRGVYASGGSYGVVATTGSGTGVYASSSSGAGVYASGGPNGVIANASSGAGVYSSSGGGDGIYSYGTANGVVAAGAVRGLYSTGNQYGVVAASADNFGVGLYASNGGFPGFAGQFLGLVDVYGDFNCYGSKSAAVPMNNGEYHAVYAEESPEYWFEDFGTARVVKGRAVVKINSDFAQTVNTNVEYHVFLTPKGDCNGLYVTNENSGSFEIRELQKGRSDLAVSYRIVAKRKGYENVRLAKLSGPAPEEVRTNDTKMRSEMAANAASQEKLRAGMQAEFKRLESEQAAYEQQKSLAVPSSQGEGGHK